ncbi:MAG TPA: envelope stress response membrane protein PspB [Novosphingobium sp.]|jgi:phage shock protein B|nr:envelope stress response membrane protein PspB [Novosphingobium sp.]HOA50266.1 envelope stress response membrane protein PspB [Novosphingobium sp.]HPZ47348.1 envelope stress response membrane protein PspB [Novosphingobium sp.]HQE00585.1 envelope stress response membrane protein PspB [Novosphingobium sp.]
MEDVLVPMMAIGGIFIGLPWLILHYVTKWKTAATLTTDDEALLGELYQLARRLEDRLETVERLVATEHADFRPGRIGHEQPLDQLSGASADLAAIETMLAKRGPRQ